MARGRKQRSRRNEPAPDTRDREAQEIERLRAENDCGDAEVPPAPAAEADPQHRGRNDDRDQQARTERAGEDGGRSAQRQSGRGVGVRLRFPAAHDARRRDRHSIDGLTRATTAWPREGPS